jgi:hypothetical protein
MLPKLVIFLGLINVYREAFPEATRLLIRLLILAWLRWEAFRISQIGVMVAGGLQVQRRNPDRAIYHHQQSPR